MDSRRALNIESERYRCHQTIRTSTSGIPESLGVPSTGGTEGRTDAARESGAGTGGTPDDAGPFTDALEELLTLGTGTPVGTAESVDAGESGAGMGCESPVGAGSLTGGREEEEGVRDAGSTM